MKLKLGLFFQLVLALVIGGYFIFAELLPDPASAQTNSAPQQQQNPNPLRIRPPPPLIRPPPPAHPIRVMKFHLAQIQSINETIVSEGVLNVEVTFWRHCNDRFVKIDASDVTDNGGAPTYAVLVLMQDMGIGCAAADTTVTESLTLPATASTYQFEAVQP